MKIKPLIYAAYLVAALGVLLHLYLTFFHSNIDSLTYAIVPLMNVIPYLVCMVITKKTSKPIIPFCSVLILLSFDVYLFNEYIFSTRTQRFLFIEIYQILFKSAVIVPAGCLIGYLIDRLINRYVVKGVE